MNSVSPLRIRTVGDREISAAGEFVLYWMTAFRRASYNFSLQRAAEWARKLRKPLVVLEALRCGYPWASDRLHQFVWQGMAGNNDDFRGRVLYYPYLEPQPGAGKGLLRALARRACLVVSDDYPCFFLPKMVNSAARQIPVRLELIDSNGLLPLRAADKVFLRAVDFRRFLQSNLLPHLAEFPQRDPLAGGKLCRPEPLPDEISRRWPAADLELPRAGKSSSWSAFPIDHSVLPVAAAGGSRAARQVLREFLETRLADYATDRNQPELNATSGLSPYLHFGHISVHEVFDALVRLAQWTPAQVARKPTGSASGWWGADTAVESFLDELITWRELGFNMCWQRTDFDQYESLPGWARQTLADHAGDRREHLYSLEQFEGSETHDELWNAAQRQLVRDGRIHNYLRMLWGKKILEWSRSPQMALQVMIQLNNKYALDGRDPNSYSGIFWVLGRYDRAWGPERPVFGKIRYMSSDNTARKVRTKQYLEKYAAAPSP